MKTQEFNWKNADGLKIFGKYHAPESGAKAVIAMVHGMGEHCQRYDSWAKRFTEKGYAFIAFDHIGHGKSEGKRGHVNAYDRLLESVDQLLDKAREYFPELPVFLYGHSMGGNVVLNYAIKNPDAKIKGIICSSPWLKLAFDPPAIQVKLGRLVNNIFPAFTQSTKLDAAAISRDPKEVEAYENDPLVHDRISTMFFISAHEAGLYALENADKIKNPLLLFHGTSDQLTSYKASEEFADKVQAPLKFELFEGAFHEIHNDYDRDKLFQLITSWSENLLN
ncbi:MAG: lysophospholipase [Chitinophagales bacterium]